MNYDGKLKTLCVLTRWDLRLISKLNPIPHNPHEKGLSSVCLCDCASILPWNIFSAVWICTWTSNWSFCEKLLKHISQVKGFSPICVLMWVSRLPFAAEFLVTCIILKRFFTSMSSQMIIQNILLGEQLPFNMVFRSRNGFHWLLQIWTFSQIWIHII